jgi:ABC-2 type transport system permease protein
VNRTTASTPAVRVAPSRGLVNAFRSELIRVTRPRLVGLGLGLSAAFGVLTTVVVFLTAKDTEPAPGSVGSFASIRQLEAAGGFFGSFQLSARLVGLVALAVWAVSVATDYSSGYVRMLVQAEPNRRRLFVGKVAALGSFTVAMTLSATISTLMAAFAIAKPADISTSSWSPGMVGEILSGYFNLTIAALAWGAVGLLIATLTKNSGIAIGVGIGWLLLLEPIIGIASAKIADYLPGGTTGALAVGGTDSVHWSTALVVTLAYAAICAAVAGSVFAKRDISD